MTTQTSDLENEIKLYGLLVDQLFRHQSIIWQMPTALISVNLIAIYNFHHSPGPLAALWLFNAAMIFVFCQMVRAQMKIVQTIVRAESVLGLSYPDFLPKISMPRYAPFVFPILLISLQALLLIRVVAICLCQTHLCWP